jgi:predicted O-methyltransferase YrrM
MQTNANLITVEIEPDQASCIRELFSFDTRLRVLTGDWKEIERHGPFRLLFVDGGNIQPPHTEHLIDLLEIGGLLVKDDLTPEEHWPDEWRGRPDPVREFWMTNQRVKATEVRVTARHAVILAVRIS